MADGRVRLAAAKNVEETLVDAGSVRASRLGRRPARRDFFPFRSEGRQRQRVQPSPVHVVVPPSEEVQLALPEDAAVCKRMEREVEVGRWLPLGVRERRCARDDLKGGVRTIPAHVVSEHPERRLVPPPRRGVAQRDARASRDGCGGKVAARSELVHDAADDLGRQGQQQRRTLLVRTQEPHRARDRRGVRLRVCIVSRRKSAVAVMWLH
mmetsp:Transcript_41502/g.100794  ORF Transcript_41502/g.100794 Transcript_41502/m.100794 type:complete len:210 (+) Transcript_41502:1314-1943(+)